MSSPILYSTNTYIKMIIQQRYRGDSHYVWCSDCFDRTKQSAYGFASIAAPSSDPFLIYQQLKSDAGRSDKHSAKITEQKLTLTKLAAEWEKDCSISSGQAEEIVYMADTADFNWWRPLLYVIPRDKVMSRLAEVHISKRASLGMEYIIPDLKRDEFDIVEF